MELIYIGIFLFAVAFAVVAIFASVALKRAANTMETLGETLSDVEKKMKHITPELQKMLEETGRTADDINDKVAAADGVFDSLNHMGTSISACNQMLHSKTTKLPAFMSPRFMDRLTDTLKWGEVANQVYRKWKKDGLKENVNLSTSKK
ncbi:DUF948 domain-containing protein [Lentibacillus cibarius]|uniref:DUF948 domain-containing protein n=1 Tax=Lentibacillus cibarius TaxID=2583219 RepID=A0A549YH55_9BACI|nr:DUF948 domain-containing protein [Lentibacillus cibarius]TRM11206.1 DUF948 domain-containing protein [Lentibacillus cibarius]